MIEDLARGGHASAKQRGRVEIVEIDAAIRFVRENLGGGRAQRQMNRASSLQQHLQQSDTIRCAAGSSECYHEVAHDSDFSSRSAGEMTAGPVFATARPAEFRRGL